MKRDINESRLPALVLPDRRRITIHERFAVEQAQA